MNEPIRIPCEGSGAISTYCPMCARTWQQWGSTVLPIPQHNRRDILAELDRGDFDEPASSPTNA